jgi:hypothetical protein
MMEKTNRLKKSRQVETAVIYLTSLAALLFSVWILYHFVTLAFSGLAQLIP